MKKVIAAFIILLMVLHLGFAQNAKEQQNNPPPLLMQQNQVLGIPDAAHGITQIPLMPHRLHQELQEFLLFKQFPPKYCYLICRKQYPPHNS